MRNRCLKTFLLSTIFLFIAGIHNPQWANAIHQTQAERFWLLKTHTEAQFDMLFLGDSRVSMGLSPAAMQTMLPNYRILNFGYGGGGLNQVIFQAAEAKLDPKSTKKIIVLGITPAALTPLAAQNEHFLQEKNRSKDYLFLITHFAPLVTFLQPLKIDALLRIDKGKSGEKPVEQGFSRLHDDGWIEAWMIPENPTKELSHFRDFFAKTQVSSELIEVLMQQTRLWKQKEIQVVAFRLPTTKEMVALEDELSGFDENKFLQAFESAGGLWLSVPLERYRSFDGSHLERNSAVLFSKDVAEKISFSLKTHKSP